MASVDVIRCCIDSIHQIADEVSDAVVYVDAGCLEAFQFIGAFPYLLELGVRAICSLENMSALDITVDWSSAFRGPAKKMVVITSRLLSDAHRYILRCLGTHRTILRCTIYTSISEVAHSAYLDSPLGPDAFHEYESLLIQDYEELIKKNGKEEVHSVRHNKISKSLDSDPHKPLDLEDGCWSTTASGFDGNTNVEAKCRTRDSYDDEFISSMVSEDLSPRLVVTVHHFPMIACPLSARVFVLPSEGTIAEACLSYHNEDALSPGLPSICNGLPSDGEDIPPGATLTAHFLYHLAAKMDLKMEIFSLGDLSRTIGKMLTDMSSLYDVGRRNKRSAGLLLIDRTLDLLTPCCHGDSVVDRMFSSLPRRKRNQSLSTKNTQISSKSPSRVERPPLDVRVLFGTTLSEGPETSTHLHERINAFGLGWNSVEVKETADLAEHMEKDQNNNSSDEISLLNGCFLSEIVSRNYVEELLARKSKDGAVLIKKLLLEAMKREKITLNANGHLGRNPTLVLHGLAESLAMNEFSLIRNRWIVQLALASEIALSEPNSSHWDAFLSAEKILGINSLDTTQSLSSQIRDLINTSALARSHEQNNSREAPQGLLSFQDALLLSMIGYILAGENFPASGSSGPFPWEEEHYLKEAVVDAILENPAIAKLQFLHGLEKELDTNSRKEESHKSNEVSAELSTLEDFDDQWGGWDDDDTDQNNDQTYSGMQLKLELRDRVDHLFKFFHKISSLKQRHSTLRQGISSESSYVGDAYTRRGFLYWLLNTLLAKYDIPGLQHHSSGVGRFLKSGFGRFGLGQGKPSFGDQEILLVFVVGGISSVEIGEVIEAVSKSGRLHTELILGGTTLLTPDDMGKSDYGCLEDEVDVLEAGTYLVTAFPRKSFVGSLV